MGTICDKIKQAIDGCFKNKAFSEKEKDLGILVLRIGGPRLLWTFDKLNMLPSKSLVSRMLNGKITMAFGYDQPINEYIDKNLAPILSEKGLLSLKMDELVIVPRIKWSCETNEIVGA